MLPIKQKQIVDIIKAGGFKTNDYIFTPIDNESFILKLKNDVDYHLTIRNKKYYIKPGQNGIMMAEGESTTWDKGLYWLEYWLKAVKENVEIGNPWEDIEDAKEQMNEMNFDSYEEIFNEEEQNKIEVKLNLLIAEIHKLNIDTTIIKEDISHLNKMSGQISKKDWILLLIGTVTSWVFSSELPLEYSQTIWGTVKTLFSGFKSKLIA